MLTFDSQEKYTMIMMRWCSGYLDDDQLINQLKIWQSWLYVSDEFCLGDDIESAIVIFDNRVDKEEDEFTCEKIYPG